MSVHDSVDGASRRQSRAVELRGLDPIGSAPKRKGGNEAHCRLPYADHTRLGNPSSDTRPS
jgi:hypothetical protein